MDFKTVADDLKSIRKELSDNLTARGITVNDTDGPTTLARKLALLNTTNTSLDSTEIYDSTVDLNGDCVKFRDYLASQLTAKGISVNDTDGPLTLAQKVNNILLTTNIVLTTDKTTLTSSDPKAHLEAKVTDLRDNPIPNVAVEFFVNGSSLSQSLTNSNGIASYDYVGSVSGTYSLTASLTAVGVYNSSVSNSVSITVKTYIFQPKFDGTESWTTLNSYGGSVTCSNNIASGGSAIMTTGFSNGNWELTAEIKLSGENCAFEIAPQGTTKWDYHRLWIMYYHSSTMYKVDNESGESYQYILGSGNLLSDFKTLKVVKNGGSFTLTLDGNYPYTFTDIPSLVSASNITIGLAKWTSPYASVKNVKVIKN